MIQPKKKLCHKCQQLKVIWKRDGREGYCKECWSCHSGTVRQTTKRTPLRPRSSKQQKLEVAYSTLRKVFIDSHPMCQAKVSESCTLKATDIHHKKGRGEYLLDASTYLSVCRSCHEWITINSKKSIELGFSILRLEDKKEE